MQVCFVVVLIAGSLGFSTGRESRQVEVDSALQVADSVFRHWDGKSGGTVLWPGSNREVVNYNLRTFDSGKNWYAVEYDQDWGMRITGGVDKVYPGPMDQSDRSLEK